MVQIYFIGFFFGCCYCWLLLLLVLNKFKIYFYFFCFCFFFSIFSLGHKQFIYRFFLGNVFLNFFFIKLLFLHFSYVVFVCASNSVFIVFKTCIHRHGIYSQFYLIPKISHAQQCIKSLIQSSPIVVHPFFFLSFLLSFCPAGPWNVQPLKLQTLFFGMKLRRNLADSHILC